MRRIVHHQLGEPARVLRVEDGPSESLGPDQVRVRVSYAPIHPGEVILHDYLEPLGMSQYALAKALGRKPTGPEMDYALTYIEKDPTKMKELAWVLFNLDEFIYVR